MTEITVYILDREENSIVLANEWGLVIDPLKLLIDPPGKFAYQEHYGLNKPIERCDVIEGYKRDDKRVVDNSGYPSVVETPNIQWVSSKPEIEKGDFARTVDFIVSNYKRWIQLMTKSKDSPNPADYSTHTLAQTLVRPEPQRLYEVIDKYTLTYEQCTIVLDDYYFGMEDYQEAKEAHNADPENIEEPTIPSLEDLLSEFRETIDE
jgi:hypothetical protein